MAHGFTTSGSWFIDPQGRHTLLRGVNLGGSTKVPSIDDGDWRTVSFVGRPAPLDELDRHLERIVHWGFNILRLLVTWEAIEHAGPGDYDEEYLDYVTEVVRRAGAHGLYVFIDPHQDVWSRWTGGDGAPFWCFELAGLRPERFVSTGAVVLDDQDWPSNYERVPAATMFTLFFGGDTFCSPLSGVGDRLQSFYLDAVMQVAERVAGFEHVLGFDAINEPSNGYIGKAELTKSGRLIDRGDHQGEPFSPLEHLAAADGITIRRDDGGVLNPEGLSIWRDGCPWRALGVWDLDHAGRPVVTSPQHFTHIDGREIRPFPEVVAPFIARFRDRLRQVLHDGMVFAEGSPWDDRTEWDDPDPLVINARHWYDVKLLYTGEYDPTHYDWWFADETLVGSEAIGEAYARQISRMVETGTDSMGERPVLLGEIGLPYDLNHGEAYRTGDYSAQVVANAAIYHALDRTLVHSTHWNYTADNSHDRGDGWNHEDFSIYSGDDRGPAADPGDLDSGGRAVDGFVRPHVVHSAGRPIAQSFDVATNAFQLVIETDPVVANLVPTEVYVPLRHYPDGVVIDASEGVAELDGQRLTWHHRGAQGRLTLWLTRAR